MYNTMAIPRYDYSQFEQLICVEEINTIDDRISGNWWLGSAFFSKKLTDAEIQSIKEYEDQIVTLGSFAAAVKQVPGMYIGNIGNVGFINMIREVFQNSLDEMMRPGTTTSKVIVRYDERTYTVYIIDDGRGIPLAKIENVFAAEHTSSNYKKKKFEYSSGRHGVGAKVTAALSDTFIARSYVLGEAKEVLFKDGEITGPAKDIPALGKQGTEVMFTPNLTVLGELSVTCDDVLKLIHSIMPLTKIGSTVIFEGIKIDGSEISETIINEDGILSDLILRAQSPIVSPIIIAEDTGEMKAEIAFTYDSANMSSEIPINNFSNFCPMRGGKHVDGFLDGVCKFFTNYMNKIYLASTNNSNNKKKKPLSIINQDIKTGLLAIVTVSALYPMFGGQSKDTLENEEMRPFVRDLTIKALEAWSKTNAKDLSNICKYLKGVAEARLASDKEKVKISNNFKSSGLSGGLPSKYVRPTGNKEDELEFIIVEGNSALGSARNSRDKVRQGIFPIRGKMPNPVTTNKTAYLNNEEVAGIISIIGCGYGKNFDISKCKFKRIIIMADRMCPLITAM